MLYVGAGSRPPTGCEGPFKGRFNELSEGSWDFTQASTTSANVHVTLVT